jgi:hypothetical protein
VHATRKVMVTGLARERKVLMNWPCEITIVVPAPASPPCTDIMVSPVRTPKQCATPPAGASDTNTPVIVMSSDPEPNITARVDIAGACEAGEVAAATSTTGIGAGFATAVSTNLLSWCHERGKHSTNFLFRTNTRVMFEFPLSV